MPPGQSSPLVSELHWTIGDLAAEQEMVLQLALASQCRCPLAPLVRFARQHAPAGMADTPLVVRAAIGRSSGSPVVALAASRRLAEAAATSA